MRCAWQLEHCFNGSSSAIAARQVMHSRAVSRSVGVGDGVGFKLLGLLVELSRVLCCARPKGWEMLLLCVLPTLVGGTHAGVVSTRASLGSSRDEAAVGGHPCVPATGGLVDSIFDDLDGQLALPVGCPVANSGFSTAQTVHLNLSFQSESSECCSRRW